MAHWHIVKWLAGIILSDDFESVCCDGWWHRSWQEVRKKFNTSRYQWQSPVKQLTVVNTATLGNGGDTQNSELLFQELWLYIEHKLDCTHIHTATRLWSPSNSFVPLGALRWAFLLLSLFMWRVDHHVQLCVSACAQTLATRLFKVHMWVRMQVCVFGCACMPGRW